MFLVVEEASFVSDLRFHANVRAIITVSPVVLHSAIILVPVGVLDCSF